MNITNVLAVLMFGIAAYVFYYTTTHHTQIARFISVKKMGLIERDFPNLKQVIVVADNVEKPSGTLGDAVEDNFREKVKYLFLVSKSRADRELNGYFLMFEALAKKAIAEMDGSIMLRDLVEIRRLSYDWPDVPYIFYQYAIGDSDERLTTAFRGNQKKEGIADAYEHLAAAHSQAIALALLAEAPAEIRVGLKVVEAPNFEEVRAASVGAP